MSIEKIKESLSDIEHRRWAHWQKYMHSKLVEHVIGEERFMCLPRELFDRWERQIITSYKDLTEKEKNSDREQVDLYLPIIEKYIQENYQPKTTSTNIEEAYNKGFDAGKLYESMLQKEPIPETYISDSTTPHLSNKSELKKEAVDGYQKGLMMWAALNIQDLEIEGTDLTVDLVKALFEIMRSYDQYLSSDEKNSEGK